jgi:uncharacterized protein
VALTRTAHVGLAGLFLAAMLTAGAVQATGKGSSLVAAAKAADHDTVRALLKGRVDVNAAEPDGATALAWAVYHDDAEMADWLIAAGANVNAANELGITPLALASANPGSPLAERLLAAGANPNAVSAAGESPLMIASRIGNVAAVKALLAKGAAVDLKEGQRGQTALMWAAAEGRSEVVRLLLAAGADVHARSSRGWTPLMFAAAGGEINSVRALVGAGAKVDDTAPGDSATPLLIAADSGAWPMDYRYWVLPRIQEETTPHEAVGLFLLDQGANPNVEDAVGRRPLHFAARTHRLALAKGLIAHGADPNARLVKTWPLLPGFLNDVTIPRTPGKLDLAGGTPFLLAAMIPDLEMMRLLVSRGADPLISTLDGTTPLMVVAGIGRIEGGVSRLVDGHLLADAARYLIDLGDNVQAVNKDGYTIAHGAAFSGSDEFLRVVAERGAPLDSRDKLGRTPADIAKGIIVNNTVIVHESTVRLLTELIKPGN